LASALPLRFRPKGTTTVSCSALAGATATAAFSSKHWRTRSCGYGAAITPTKPEGRGVHAASTDEGRWRGIGLDADDVRTMKRRERRAPGNPKGIVASS